MDGVTAGPGPDQRDPVPLPLPAAAADVRRLGQRRRGGRPGPAPAVDLRLRQLGARTGVGERRRRRGAEVPRRPLPLGRHRPGQGPGLLGLHPARLRQPRHRPAPDLVAAGHRRPAGRLARRRPPRRPGVLRLLLVARRRRPRRHLHRQRQDDRRAAGGRVGQGPGRRHPDGHPPGPARADDDGRAGGDRCARSPACPTPTCSRRAASRYGVDAVAARRVAIAGVGLRRRRRSPRPARRASCSSCRPPRKGLGRQPARPGVGDRRRRPLPQQPDQAVRLHRPGAGRLQRRPGHGAAATAASRRTPRPRTTSAP